MVLAALLLLGVTAGQARAVRYVALGDSYSSGTGTRTYYDSSCQRSVYSYPYLVHTAHPSWTFIHAACSGAKTGDLINVQSASLTSGTDWVTYTIGGNDAGFSSVITECAQPWWSSDCDGASTPRRLTSRARCRDGSTSVNNEIKSKSPTAKVIVPELSAPLHGRGLRCRDVLHPDEETRLNPTADMVRNRIRAAARRAGANFVFKDAIRPFVGHAVCDSAQWVNGLSNPIGESYHPNRTGHRRGYAKLVRAVLG